MAKTYLQHFKTGPSAAVREVASVTISGEEKTVIDTQGRATAWRRATFCRADGTELEPFIDKGVALRAKRLDPDSPKVKAKAEKHAKQKDAREKAKKDEKVVPFHTGPTGEG
jgi:hypothetical protein